MRPAGLLPLAAEVAQACALLEGSPPPGPPDPGSPLAALCRVFGLSAFERGVLVLCAAVELDGSIAEACRRGHGRDHVTFGIALATVPEPHWSALAPTAPLRYWRLVELEPGPGVTNARLRLDERVLHFLAGVSHLDARLDGIVEEVVGTPPLAASHAALAERMAETLAGGSALRVQLVGHERATRNAVAAAACGRAGRRLFRLDANLLPHDARGLAELAALWEREAALTAGVLLVDADRLEASAAEREPVARLARRLHVPLVVTARDPLPEVEEAELVEVGPVSTRERKALWRETLGPAWSEGLNGGLDAFAGRFPLDPGLLAEAGREALAGSGDPQDRLWEACRARARPQLDDLAERIVSAADWDDLVLPESAVATLEEIAAQVQWRETVYEDWGFAARGSRGLGISALFVGPSGTGKTMAAEVVANALALDLYRVDLSSVVSKYIGETEKNLRRVFDAADRGAAVLLFDEADALFGRRTEVKDSHDRFANIEVSYLLQRMEAYRGLAILTTNRRDAIDEAFLRRIRFVVEFPFPDAEQRTEIWRRVFPAAVPLEGVDAGALSALTVAGGNIRNIALGAAFLAADERGPVRMEHVRRSARTEYAKLERPLSSAELAET